MIVVTNNWKIWLAGMAVSLGIFLIIYLTVIKPTTDTANDAVRSGLQQSQQALDQAEKPAGGAGGAAKKTLSDAQTLTGCLAEAGTDTGAVQDCQAQFGN